ncbi:MAG TPA: MBL fold metallo-hydrolase [Armatimonadota bacterium]|nr:MBL fold metallo-hydrolase [Armatimonadota bacterium]
MEVIWLTQGGFLFDSAETRLVVDPYMSDNLASHDLPRLVPFPLPLSELRPNWCLCTHDHLDHLDPESITAIAQAYPACHFAGPESCYKHFIELGIEAERCHTLIAGEAFECGNISVMPTMAIHSDPFALGMVIDHDGKALYLSGDSEYSPELVNAMTKQCASVLICINGKWGNMTLDEALQVIKGIKPEIALPMHYGLFARNTADPQPFIEQCKQWGVQAFAMQPGKPFAL